MHVISYPKRISGRGPDRKDAKMARENTLRKRLRKKFGDAVKIKFEEDRMILSGNVDTWQDALDACGMCATRYGKIRVVNDICAKERPKRAMRVSSIRDEKYDGMRPDVLVIGGGIIGASVLRELTKWKIKAMLIEKESDLAMQTSGRNDGEVHPGVDLGKGSLKQKYVLEGNRIFDRVCEELDVPFVRCGQYIGFTERWLKPFVALFALQRKYACGVKDTKIVSRKKLREAEPHLNKKFAFALHNASAGCVCPYGLTIAYGENAVRNGAIVALNTAALGMDAEGGEIRSVATNRGTIYPKIVVNCAGTFAEDVAEMAGDRFYSIHPRRGTNSILDKKAGHILKSIASIKTVKNGAKNTKGGGMLHTAHDNVLVGPNAVETWEKENFATDRASIDEVFAKQANTVPELKRSDVITYFTGVRAATFEEDFVIERGHRTHNLIHCAGIQSPGLTAAPAIAVDVAKAAADMLKETMPVEENPEFDPIRKGIPRLRDMPDAERDEMIRKNPDYGVIVCRCEEISKGEIVDALRAPIVVPTVDGVKKRVRPGMGRCQGGFCMPLVMKIISETLGVPLEEIRKSGADSRIAFGKTKEAEKEE